MTNEVNISNLNPNAVWAGCQIVGKDSKPEDLANIAGIFDKAGNRSDGEDENYEDLLRSEIAELGEDSELYQIFQDAEESGTLSYVLTELTTQCDGSGNNDGILNADEFQLISMPIAKEVKKELTTPKITVGATKTSYDGNLTGLPKTPGNEALSSDLADSIIALANGEAEADSTKSAKTVTIDAENGNYSSLVSKYYGVNVYDAEGVNKEYILYQEIAQDAIADQNNNKYEYTGNPETLLNGLSYTLPDVQKKTLDDGSSIYIAGENCYILDENGDITKCSIDDIRTEKEVVAQMKK